jgi:anti-anti-sigma factor
MPVRYRVEQKSPDSVVLGLDGEMVDEERLSDLTEALEEHYVNDGVEEIVLDLSGVTYISLEGLGVLIALWRETLDRGKRFAIVGAMSDQVQSKLRQTGVLRISRN